VGDTGCRLSQKSVQDVRVGVMVLLFGADYVTATVRVVGICVVVGDFPVVSGGGSSGSGGASGAGTGGCGNGGGDGDGFCGGVSSCNISGGGCDVERGRGGGVVGHFGGRGRRGRRNKVPIVSAVV